ncbi:galactose-specific lectin nattectin-like [Stigmatopora argus]
MCPHSSNDPLFVLFSIKTTKMTPLYLFIVLFGLTAQIQGVALRKDSKSHGNHCPKGWTQLDENCYIFQDGERTFSDAESICNILDGNLVSINSAKENVLIVELIRECKGEIVDTWIGLHDAIEEGEFIWTDGEIVNFSGFAPGQPDSNASDEDCVEIENRDDMWHDVPCTDLNPFVCMKPVDKKSCY